MGKRVSDMGISNQVPTFPPRFRLYAAVLGGCIAFTLAWVAYVDTTWARYFAALFCFVIGTLTAEGIRRETGVVRNCLVASGKVTSLRRGRRGAHITYSFRAFDGKEYTGTSFWSVRGVEAGGTITVVYAAMNPHKNLPQSGFLFYEFKSKTPGVA
jgi:hypothetical protein